MQKPDAENKIFNIAAGFIRNSNHPVFLTGKAGTGKTTFLRYIKENCVKQTAIVAPTGVAAINAGGTTIHSFFQLPFGPFLPTQRKWGQSAVSNKSSLMADMKLSNERKEIMQQLELLIIDEVSMVRCDVLDAIDTVLRQVRKQYSKPFGGVQVLYIGDMYQLPPVVKEEEWKILSEVYSSPFFFGSQVIQEQLPVYVELQKVYRQTDENFIRLLNQVRNNEMDDAGYSLLHSRFMPEFTPGNDDNFITLTTHNHKAEAINSKALRLIPHKQVSFKAGIDGSFQEGSFPADEVLLLKPGAQVMFLKNDMEKVKRFYNGKIGVVQQIDDDKIWVECLQHNNKQLIEVKRETWQNIRYSLNHTTKQIEEETLGSFTQFPLRLAWAITIHKSQGLTFQKAIIDAAGAFAPGQVYVALSRCTSLEGIVLHSKINFKSLISDQRIVDFAASQVNIQEKEALLRGASKEYEIQIVRDALDFSQLEFLLEEFRDWLQLNNFFGQPVIPWIDSFVQKIFQFAEHGKKFSVELNTFFEDEPNPSAHVAFLDRFKKAAEWYFTAFEKFQEALKLSPGITDNKQQAKDYNARLQKIFTEAAYKSHLFSAYRSGFSIEIYSSQKSSFTKPPFTINAHAAQSEYVPKNITHPELFSQLKLKRNEMADQKGIAVFLICKTQALEEMCHLLPRTADQLKLINGLGAAKIRQYGNTFLELINAYCELNNMGQANEVFDTNVIKRKSAKMPPQGNRHKTNKISFELFKAGKSIAAIAEERKLAVSTVEGHLSAFIENGSLDVHLLIDQEKFQQISTVIRDSGQKSMRALKDQMPFASYSEIRWVQASLKIPVLQNTD